MPLLDHLWQVGYGIYGTITYGYIFTVLKRWIWTQLRLCENMLNYLNLMQSTSWSGLVRSDKPNNDQILKCIEVTSHGQVYDCCIVKLFLKSLKSDMGKKEKEKHCAYACSLVTTKQIMPMPGRNHVITAPTYIK
jgi:hypothetical protein